MSSSLVTVNWQINSFNVTKRYVYDDITIVTLRDVDELDGPRSAACLSVRVQ